MYRDDREAMASRIEALAKVEQQNELLQRELLQLRRTVASSYTGNPYLNPRALGPAERQVLGEHDLISLPVWAAGLLHLVTFGLFSVIFFGMQQGRMPRAAENDPTTGQSIGLHLVPIYNIYWMFFDAMRLCDRVTLQYRLRGREEQAPRGLAMAASICTVPWVGAPFAVLFLWPIVTCLLQHRINRLIELGPVPLEGDPALSARTPAPQLTARLSSV